MPVPRLTGTFRNPSVVTDAPDTTISQIAQALGAGVDAFQTIKMDVANQQAVNAEIRKQSLVDSLAETIAKIDESVASGAIDATQAELMARKALLETARRAEGDKETLSTLATTFKNLTGFDAGGFSFVRIKEEKERQQKEEQARRDTIIKMGLNPDDSDDVAMFNQMMAAANAAALTDNLLKTKANQQKLEATEVYEGFLAAAEQANALFGAQLLKATKEVGGNLNNLTVGQKEALFSTLEATFSALEAQVKSKSSFYRDLDDEQRRNVLELLSVNKNAWKKALLGESSLEFAAAMNKLNNAAGELLLVGTPEQAAKFKQIQLALGSANDSFVKLLLGGEVGTGILRNLSDFFNKDFATNNSRDPKTKIIRSAAGAEVSPLSGNKEEIAKTNQVLADTFDKYKELNEDDKEILTDLMKGISVTPNNVGLKAFESIANFVERNGDKLKDSKFRELRKNISVLFGQKLSALTGKALSEVDSNISVVVRDGQIEAVPVDDDKVGPDAVGRFAFPEVREQRAENWNRKYGRIINKTLSAMAKMTGNKVEDFVNEYAKANKILPEQEADLQAGVAAEQAALQQEEKTPIDRQTFDLLLKQVKLGGLDPQTTEKVLLNYFTVRE